MDEVPITSTFLKDPLSLSDLIGGGGFKFEVNTNFDDGLSNGLFEDLQAGSDEEDADESIINQEAFVSPWTKSFAELKQQMDVVHEFLHKKITRSGKPDAETVPLNARVSLRYNAYMEGEGAPFDSSFMRGSSFSFYTGRKEVLEGLEAAVMTMRPGEEAQFVISYHLLFGEMGCPPRVKPKADSLFIIELLSYNLVGDIDADQKVPEEDRNKYALIIDKVKDIHLKGLDFFGQGFYNNSIRAFEKARDVLNYCRLANEEEEAEQTKFLIKLCTNLAVCFIKVNSPSKACIMCKEIRRLSNNTPSCKAVFQEGRALLMLGEFERSRQLLTQAQHMEPQNEEINKELRILEERLTRYKKNSVEIWSKAMGVINKASSNSTEAVAHDNDENDKQSLDNEMLSLMQSFKNNIEMKVLKLPPGLTDQEIDSIGNLAKRMELRLSLSPLDNSSYSLNK